MRRAFNSRFDRAYHEIHGSRAADELEAVEIDVGVFVAQPQRSTTWSRKTPLERFMWLWGMCVLAVAGFFLGMIAVSALGVLILAIS